MAKRPPPKQKLPVETLTDEEVRRLVEVIGASGPIAIRNKALIVLLWRSGLRISEALSLRPSDLSPDGRINIRRGKGAKQRVAHYDHEVVPYLDHWLTVRASLGVKARQPLFCSISRGTTRTPGDPIDPAYYRQLLPKMARKAGISKRVHAHGLRHTLASELERAGLRLGDIAVTLGHKRTSTTDAYLRRISGGEVQDALNAVGRGITPPAA